MKVGVIQFNSNEDVELNLKFFREQLVEAKKQNVQLVCVPENFPFVAHSKEGRKKFQKKISDDVIAQIQGWAKEFNLNILTGGHHTWTTDDSKLPFNRIHAFSPEGVIVQTYDKVHLCDLEVVGGPRHFESEVMSPGHTPQILDLKDLGVWGLSICFDLRFPLLFQKLRKMGAQVLFVPAAFFYHTGRMHWEVLLRARAIENQSYVVAPAQTGMHGPERRSWGHSMIISPWGEILVNAKEELGLFVGELDFQEVESMRRQIPVTKYLKDI
ncbi:MAG: carbon-nitrogen hydrolase family protein [Bacteriovoracaceae bacterium]|nr:carbon-nitrogen hydrolase family protein [Bacteriovoracaceae bacterium]